VDATCPPSQHHFSLAYWKRDPPYQAGTRSLRVLPAQNHSPSHALLWSAQVLTDIIFKSMKLFLSSLASTTLDLAKPLLPYEPSQLKLAFIATATDPYGDIDMPWLDADRAKLIAMGFKLSDYDLKNKTASQLRADLSSFDVIFVSGGNTYYLLEIVRKTGFDQVLGELLDKGAIYIGASAGSVLLCPTIDHVRLIEHPEVVPDLVDFRGLGLTDYLIAPHYGKQKYESRYKQIIQDWGDRILLLKDNQALMINGDKIELVTNQEEKDVNDY